MTYESSAPATLLVASTGGHLEQLIRLSARLQPQVARFEWVTSESDQARSLLSGETVHHLRYVAPRHGHVVARDLPTADAILRRGNYARVVTTGSGMALSVLLAARARGIPCHWIESSARAVGPSLSGRIVSRVPGMHLYTQYPSWATSRWSYKGSVLDDYVSQPRTTPADGRARRVVVTLGTMRTYGFRRAVESVLRLLPEVTTPGAEVFWQTGATDVSGLGIEAHDSVPAATLRSAIAAADLVIAHAGVGSALMALDQGRAPLLMVRRKAHDEHVDDHQLMIADELTRRGLAVKADPDEVTAEDLRAAMLLGAGRSKAAAPFELIE